MLQCNECRLKSPPRNQCKSFPSIRLRCLSGSLSKAPSAEPSRVWPTVQPVSSSRALRAAVLRRAVGALRSPPGRRHVRPATRWFSQEKNREGQHRARSAFIGPSTPGTRSPRFRRPVVRPGPAQAQRLRPWRATAGVGEVRTRLPRFGYALACEQTPPAGSFHQESVVRERELMSLGTKRPNPSIERTVKRLRLSPAAHVNR